MNSQDKSAPTIGIVIPIYNVAPYLRECLDSVANQTYGNFCAVLVNDGSTDNSKEIVLDYVAKDSRFVLIDKENSGQSSARNAGIDYFSGGMDSSLLDSMNRAPLSSLRGKAEAIHKNKTIDCHNLTSSSLAMTNPYPSLRGSVSEANTTKQSKQNQSHEVQTESYQTYTIDCFGQSPRNDGVNSKNNNKYSSLQGKAEAIQTARHTERSEVSKSHESQINNESMTKVQINKSHRFAQSQRITNDLQIAKVDSSLRMTNRAT